jgi:hypothetical protein
MPEPVYETRPLREDERDWRTSSLFAGRGTRSRVICARVPA